MSDAALGWAAAARKEQDRVARLVQALHLAVAAGVPQPVLAAALADAEFKAHGGRLPERVWDDAGIGHMRASG